ncbi:single-stranded DNA-binding protein [Bradyrhizobium yuanmingense]|uniref:single-stranded DNA-binding protein n=1 Tax=Bradyrhizobium yuanmingense TaxID=108015 RepID=UPI0004AC774C|nr:single-stranded DNA-binding protein [Bradyrhizobium yuanmingense]
MLNKVQLIGNLGNDPDVKYTQSGACVTTISIATTKKWKDRDGNPQEKTSWHRVKLWNKLGEIAGEYLRKGSKVYIEGELDYGSYEKDGVTHYTTDIIASEMKMLDGRRDGDNDNGQRQGGQQQRQAPRQEYGGGGGGQRQGGGYGQQQPSSRQREQPQQPPMDDFVDDDIPF